MFLVNDAVANQDPKFTVTGAKFDAPVITLSTQDNPKLPEQLKSGFK